MKFEQNFIRRNELIVLRITLNLIYILFMSHDKAESARLRQRGRIYPC
jgi:hypothetical protein